MQCEAILCEICFSLPGKAGGSVIFRLCYDHLYSCSSWPHSGECYHCASYIESYSCEGKDYLNRANHYHTSISFCVAPFLCTIRPMAPAPVWFIRREASGTTNDSPASVKASPSVHIQSAQREIFVCSLFSINARLRRINTKYLSDKKHSLMRLLKPYIILLLW